MSYAALGPEYAATIPADAVFGIRSSLSVSALIILRTKSRSSASRWVDRFVDDLDVIAMVRLDAFDAIPENFDRDRRPEPRSVRTQKFPFTVARLGRRIEHPLTQTA